MDEANKDECRRCIQIAKKCISEGQKQKALKFLQKAEKLCPTDEAKHLIRNLEQCGEDNSENDPSSQPQEHTEGPRRRQQSDSHGDNRHTADGHTYTTEQQEAVNRIRHCKDYYEMLNLDKNFTEAQIKKSYRKLALILHPDKNKAPGAAEAFKAVGNAYAVLSAPDKRQRYDMYGANEAHTPPRSRRGNFDYDYTHGFEESEFTAEEIFNMFFGGGYPQGGLNRRGQFFYRTRPRDEQSQQQNEGGMHVLLQLLPFFILITLSLLSTLLVGDAAYSLHRTDKYYVERHTSEQKVPYYVQADFLKRYGGSILKIERQVEQDYVDALRSNCYRERLQKEQRLWHARNFGDGRDFERASKATTPSCDKLQQMYYAHNDVY